jgi:hypothetical protein
MKINKKMLISTMLILSVMVFSNIATVQSSPQIQEMPRPISMDGPRGDIPLFQWLKNGFVSILFGMSNANFSSGDVLFSEFTTNDQFTRTLNPYFSNASRTLNLTNFKLRLNDFLASPTVDLPGSVMTFLNNLNTEMGNNTELTVSKFTKFAPTKTIDQKSRFVVILWDPDKSVINTINEIQNDQIPSSQPFTGDEVLTSVRMDRIIDKVYGRFIENVMFEYGNGTIAKKMAQFGNLLNEFPILGKKIVKALNLTDMRSLRNFAGSIDGIDTTLSLNQAKKNVNLGFTVSQLQINNLTLRKMGNEVRIQDFAATLVEHNALGLTIFNDTNKNGIMDLEMRTVDSDRPGLNQTVVPAGSEEALFRVDFKSAASSEYVPLSKTADKDELTFSFTANDITVNLNPVTRNLDETLFSGSTDLTQTINEFGYKFRFSPNATASKAEVKFDFLLGEWSNKTMLAGLSLNKMVVTGISDFSGRQRVMKMNPGDESSLDPDQTSRKARKFQITAGQAPLAEVELDQKPYLVAGTTEEIANGQTLPLLFVNLLFGRITSQGDVLRTIGGSVTSSRYLYSLSYPVFGGESIEHDPTFSIISGASEGGDLDSPDGASGFEFLTLLAIPSVLLYRKKNK